MDPGGGPCRRNRGHDRPGRGAPQRHVPGGKGLPGDYVTDVDLASRPRSARYLREATPDIPVHGEEGGGETGDRYWVVDPLDGTTNFAHGFPAVGVSVALVERGLPIAGSVCAPFLGTTYVAGRGEGCWAHRGDAEPVRLKVSDRPASRAVVATGFPFRRKARLLQGYLITMTAALARFEDLRRPGAAEPGPRLGRRRRLRRLLRTGPRPLGRRRRRPPDPRSRRRRHRLGRRPRLDGRRHHGRPRGHPRRTPAVSPSAEPPPTSSDRPEEWNGAPGHREGAFRFPCAMGPGACAFPMSVVTSPNPWRPPTATRRASAQPARG